MAKSAARPPRRHGRRARRRSAGNTSGAAGSEARRERKAAASRPAQARTASGRARKSSGASGVASEIVHRAAAILEEEIAAGIVAAKQVEARFLGSDEVSDAAPQELIQRFRKDAHEVADAVMDFLATITRNLGALADHFGDSNGTGESRYALTGLSRRNSGSLRVAASEGETARATLKVGCPGHSEETRLIFLCTDLVAYSGCRLPAACVTFVPDNLGLAPGAEASVEVALAVPDRTPAGVYLGLIRWGQGGDSHAVLEVCVE